MFELGTSLREARRKRGLELDAVQRETRIRRRYLEAIENERFDLLPGVAYARGFLREYAEFLGLDGALYVQEYNERFAPREELPIAPVPRPPFAGRGGPWPVVVLLGLAAVAAAVGLAAWQLGGSGKTAARSTPATTATTPPPRSKPKPKPTAAPPGPSRLLLTAARGDCWIAVRLGSAGGKLLYENTLHTGSRLVFGLARPLWVRVGAGQNLDARVDGRPLALPSLVGDVVVQAPARG